MLLQICFQNLKQQECKCDNLGGGYEMLEAGYWMLDTGCWILDARFWILDAGFWMPEADLIFNIKYPNQPVGLFQIRQITKGRKR